jgi:hypothetical protein
MSFNPVRNMKSRYLTTTIASNNTINASKSVSYSITSPTHNYYILGNKVVGNSFDTFLAMIIASINLHGIEYYVELKKQGVEIHNEKVKEFLEYQLISYERDKKIEKIIDDL